jgi:hypothetical protein
MLLPKSYAATASVVPPVDLLQKESALLGAVKSPMLRQAMNATGIVDMYVGILRSRSVADALVERFDLGQFHGIKASISAVRQTLQGRTTVRVTSEGIIAITVEDSDPCRAALWPMPMSRNWTGKTSDCSSARQRAKGFS